MTKTRVNKNVPREDKRRNKEIYRLKKEGYSYSMIAQKFNLTQPRVHQIVQREKKRSK